MMTGAHAILNGLTRHNIDTIFGYPGGAIMPFYDALAEQHQLSNNLIQKQNLNPNKIQHILCRHEQACALAADGYARRSGRLGVCVATSGPGATNLITGVANALMDSIPMLIITGQVPAALIGTDAFQELDVLGLTLGVVKHSFLVTEAKALPKIMDDAIKLACSGRPGPVWIDITKDALQQGIAPHTVMHSQQNPLQLASDTPAPNQQSIAKARALMQHAKRPLLYSGGGVRLANAVEPLREFANITGMPSVVSLNGIGNHSSDDPMHMGMLGMHGSVVANQAVQDADLLICVGVRFDDRATGNLAGFAPDAKVIHLDIDHAEIHKRRTADVALLDDLSDTLAALKMPLNIQPWLTDCHHRKREQQSAKQQHTQKQGAEHQNGTPEEYIQENQMQEQATQERSTQERCTQNKINNISAQGITEKASDGTQTISGPAFLRQLSQATPHNTTYTCDVGQHQMWVAQHIAFDHPRLHLSSGGLGTMGYGLPAAIGAQLAATNQLVIAVCGDGSFQMNCPELATVKRYHLPIKIVLMDNQVLGMVRQQQELFFESRFSEIDLSDNPDFCMLTQAYGIETKKIACHSDTPAAIQWLINTKGPALLHVCLSEKENVWPIVKPGAANTDYLLEATHD